MNHPSMIAAAIALLSASPLPAQDARQAAASYTFAVPTDWTHVRRGGAAILEAPERGSWITLIDVKAQDPEAAVKDAWSVYRGGRMPDRRTDVPVANRNGWQDGRSFSYVAQTSPPRTLTMSAMRHGRRWVVRIKDWVNAVGSKRSADIRSIRESVLPVGYTRESLAGRKAHHLDRARVAALTAFVENARAALGVPGISIGIVQDGRTLFAGGFGVREVGKPARVDADTLYPIASNTKPLTTLMLAKLVDEGRLGWDAPVAALLPRFRVADGAFTHLIRVRHLLCACTGLPYRNLDWEFAPADAPAQITFDILARMRPTSPFGSIYQYSNPIAAAAGYVGGHVAYPELDLGTAYDRVMQTRVIVPLGMKRTTFDFDRAMRGNFARSHGISPTGEFALVDPARDRKMHAVRPAGGAWSNVDDLLRYVGMELSGGLDAEGRRYISEKALKARWASQIATGAHSWYGMGLDTDMSSGTPMLYHGGRLYGQRSNVIWWPEHGVGAVILMNSATGNVPMDAFPRKIMELMFDGRPEADSMVAAAAVAEPAQREAWRRSLVIPAAPDHAAGLAKRYRSDLLGDIRVTRDAGRTVFDFGSWRAPVASRSNADGTVDFVLVTASSPFPFTAGKDGDRRTLTIRDAQNAYVFTEDDGAKP